MSREVRRVPLGWKHPTQPNPYWREQASTPYGRSKPASKLHGPTEEFVSLLDDYPGHLADWEGAIADIRARTGFDWTFAVKYHLTGCKGGADNEPTIHPFYGWSGDGETEIPIDVRDEDHLQGLLLAEKERERPDPADYMPTWDTPKEDLGWCLYQTVSEGSPVTPVFATADELIEHLATVGQDWEQRPMRREAAEALVRQGYSLGSFVVAGGVLYDSANDADRLPHGRTEATA